MICGTWSFGGGKVRYEQHAVKRKRNIEVGKVLLH